MPRPSTAIAILVRSLTLSVCFLGFLESTPRTASAGPIADRIKQWSTQRQSQSRVEKPFSGQSGNAEINGPSMAQKLRQRLTLKPKEGATSHQMKVEKFNHEGGTLVR